MGVSLPSQTKKALTTTISQEFVRLGGMWVWLGISYMMIEKGEVQYSKIFFLNLFYACC